MTEVTLEITQYCPNHCDYCSSNAGPDGKPLDTNTILSFLSNLKLTKNDRINISGGEPLSHPDFFKILTVCYLYTSNVWIYTNMIRNIIFNADFIDGIAVHANVCIVPGRAVKIPERADCVHLLKLVHQGRARELSLTSVVASHNFIDSPKKCSNCKHILLQADGKVVEAPCKKDYSDGVCDD